MLHFAVACYCHGVRAAACLLTISDSFVAPEITTAEQRQTSFTNMMKVALGAEY